MVRSRYVLALLVATACTDQRPAFECRAHDDCTHATADGVCEPTGYCSFPDASCSSGRRYGEHASDDVAELCVDDCETALVDMDFDDGVIDTAAWLIYGDVAATQGALACVLGEGAVAADTYVGIQTRAPIDLGNGRVVVEVLDTVDPDTNAQTTLHAFSDDTTGLSVKQENGSLRCQLSDGTTSTVLSSVPYDRTEHRFWQLRTADGVVYWETSPDGARWVTHVMRSVAGFRSDAVHVGIESGTYQPESAPGRSIFDNLRACR